MTGATHINYQLDEISSVVEEHLEYLSRLDNPANPLPDATVIKHVDHVRLHIRENESHDIKVLILTPLFPGSFSQNEVVIECLGSNGLRHVENATLLNAGCTNERIANNHYEPSVIEPALHYARFNALPDSLDNVFHAENKPITVIVEKNNAGVLEYKDLISRKLDHVLALHPLCNDIIITQLSYNQHSSSQGNKTKIHSSENHNEVKIPESISIHRSDIKKAEQLFTLFARSQVALVPSLSLAMDATSAGCPSSLYACNHLSNEIIDKLESLDATGNLQLSQIQHKAIRKFQIEKNNVRTLIKFKSELYTIINKLNFGSNGEKNTTVNKQIQQFPENVIIPLNSHRSTDVKEHLTNTRSKFRKLRHSPKQFLQDSRNPKLRKLGNLRSI